MKTVEQLNSMKRISLTWLQGNNTGYFERINGQWKRTDLYFKPVISDASMLEMLNSKEYSFKDLSHIEFDNDYASF